MNDIDAINQELERLHDLLNRTTSPGTAQILFERVCKFEEFLLQAAKKERNL